MRRADRQFQLVNLIRRQQPIYEAKLAEQLQVSVRFSGYLHRLEDLNPSR